MSEHSLCCCVGGSSSEQVKLPLVASGKGATWQNLLLGSRGVSFSHCMLLVETKKQQLSCLCFALGQRVYLLAGIVYLLFWGRLNLLVPCIFIYRCPLGLWFVSVGFFWFCFSNCSLLTIISEHCIWAFQERRRRRRLRTPQPALMSGMFLMTTRGCTCCPVQICKPSIKQVKKSLRFATPCNEK